MSRVARQLTGFVCLAALILLGGYAVDPAADSKPASDRDERASWWFPWFAATGTQQTFQTRVVSRVSRAGRVESKVEEVSFDVKVFAQPGGDKCLIKLVPASEEPAEANDGPASLWIQNWAVSNPDGLVVAQNRIQVGGADVFRGPFRAGDRFTMGGFAALFFGVHLKVVGFCHFEVADVAKNHAKLRFDFWLGETGPAVQGQGELAFENDAQGMTAVRASWQRSDGVTDHLVELKIDRVAVAGIR